MQRHGMTPFLPENLFVKKSIFTKPKAPNYLPARPQVSSLKRSLLPQKIPPQVSSFIPPQVSSLLPHPP